MTPMDIGSDVHSASIGSKTRAAPAPALAAGVDHRGCDIKLHAAWVAVELYTTSNAAASWLSPSRKTEYNHKGIGTCGEGV